ncbi:MAG: hypothetical protein ABIO39_10555 [Caulobacteraceae bacterium]
MKRTTAPFCAALLAGLAAAAALAAQAQDTSRSPPTSPRVTAKQGITGTWERFQRPGPDEKLPPGVVVPPRIQTPPFTPEHLVEYQAAAKAAREADLAGKPIAINSVQCIPEGMIAMMNAIFPMEVLETPGQVTVIQESYNQVRHIYLGEAMPKLEDIEPGFFGYSVGHWEGKTLVVDTAAVKEIARFRQGAEPQVPHSLEMKINERIRLVAPDFLQDEVTITDPKYLAAPWKFTYLYKRSPGYKIQEYICEDNRAYIDAEGHTHVNFGAPVAKK